MRSSLAPSGKVTKVPLASRSARPRAKVDLAMPRGPSISTPPMAGSMAARHSASFRSSAATTAARGKWLSVMAGSVSLKDEGSLADAEHGKGQQDDANNFWPDGAQHRTDAGTEPCPDKQADTGGADALLAGNWPAPPTHQPMSQALRHRLVWLFALAHASSLSISRFYRTSRYSPGCCQRPRCWASSRRSRISCKAPGLCCWIKSRVLLSSR